jgi:threonine aldolase
MTEDYEAIIATPDAHIATHETGSVGACGRTILLTSDTDGFMSIEAAERVYQQFTSGGRHMVKPAVVYLTNATELGGVYTRAQLEELSSWAHERGLRVYLDGARLGSALTSPANDLTLPQLAALVDVFTIGGTKNGMLFGEAVVSRDARLNRTFGYVQKQRGGLMAKGRLYGVQYVAAFESGLYWELAKAANAAAQKLAEGLCALGWEPYGNSPSNQRFFVVEPALAKEAAARWGCEVYSTLPSGKQVIRFVCSWATTLEDIDELLASARALS